MNGIEALKALKEGFTVAHISANGIEIDRYYRFCPPKKEYSISVPHMWFRWADEWLWKEAKVEINFWILAKDDEFEIIEGVN